MSLCSSVVARMRTGKRPPRAISIPSPRRTGEKPLDVGLREVEGLPDRSQRRRVLLEQQLEGAVLQEYTS